MCVFFGYLRPAVRLVHNYGGGEAVVGGGGVGYGVGQWRSRIKIGEILEFFV